MNPFSLLVLAFAMSTDAFAAAVGKGAGLRHPKLSEALRMGLIFGIIEAITPLVGWLIGQAASDFVESWDHWIAFVLLAGIGGHMVHAGLQPPDEDQERPSRHSFLKLAITAVGTSIDALAVGVTLAFADVSILVASACIGIATMTMVTLGVMLGRTIGNVLGHRAEIFGGIVLFCVGFSILYDHLF